jgi:hypothetical protein
MVQPFVKAPGRLGGAVLRKTGKQTLSRPHLVVPGTALKDARVGSRDAVVRARQARKDAKKPEQHMTVRQVQKRVDESFGAEQKHRTRIERAIQRKAAAEAKKLPKAQAQGAHRGVGFGCSWRGEGSGSARVRPRVRSHRLPRQATAVLVKPKDATRVSCMTRALLLRRSLRS